MLTLTLTDCPAGLRGDLTKWLLEIDTGVFVGNINARVRGELWSRVVESCKNGRAVLVYDAPNEQGLSFKTHGSTWEPIDFDGIKLILKPSASRLKAKQEVIKTGFSNASKIQTAKKFSKARSRLPEAYVVVDVETTGLNPDRDGLLEIGAIKITAHNQVHSSGALDVTAVPVRDGVYNALIKTGTPIPPEIERLTGISSQMIADGGIPLRDALNGFISFLGDLPIIAHNADFDMSFLSNACVSCGLPLITNRCVDTLALARKLLKGIPNYKLGTLAEHFCIPYENAHRSISDCGVTQKVYEKLMEIANKS